MVEFHRNGLLVRFLVGVLAISAQRGRYHRFFTGTIDNESTPNQEEGSDVAAEDVIARRPDAVFPHHYESLLLEGDAEVWSS